MAAEGRPAPASSATPTATLGELYLAQGHRGEAAAIFQRVLEADPENRRARAGLERLRGTGKPAAAVQSGAAGGGAGRKADRAAALRSYLRRLRGGSEPQA